MGVSERRPYHRSPQLERALELLAAARDKPRRRLYLDQSFVVDLAGRLVFGLPSDANLALHDESLRARAALGEAALNDKDVKATLQLLDEGELPDLAMRERAVDAE